ncbi:acetoin dehydrogenase dihydrolipoyllysine-residue acetyltransferase subunit [Sphingomonas sp. CL5.1]|uniref:acetoin dehydrogenase dihydrolipoyllysine-residue acetyltransferase subunit n=1 Tax=Sphingomonas sp. CL5.1 TaxID=2653203 RepID=UPI00158173D8|nr:acetoin dehydrogenase dihydrolipoyllysine-residue acetyltransferase subunit [Sphingomonas sp. CL5.1]QKR99877.1 acetoin dehydrogenase dihydrolipoyllysine-residue acetyltransferase subunit [Sphingomonas sp. CL5.1]
MSEIVAITMPKWGLTMTEGTVTTWWKKAGDSFVEGDELVDIETSKINNNYDAPFAGRLARIVASEGDTVPVGGLIGISAPEETAAAELDAFAADFSARFVPETQGEAADTETPRQTVTVGDKEYRINVIGDLATGDVTVLIHGFSGDLDNWLFNIEAIASLGPVISLDLPGHGASDKRLQSGSLAELSGAVKRVLDALHVERCDIVGHSLGCAVAMRIALDRPALVRSIVLLAPAGLPGPAVNMAFIHGVVEAQNSRQLLPVLRDLFADPDAATREMADEMMKYKRLDGVDEALAKIAAGLESGDELAALQPDLGRLPRTTVIYGQHDRVTGLPDLTALPPGWQVVAVDAGHMLHMEQVEEINILVVEALTGADA